MSKTSELTGVTLEENTPSTWDVFQSVECNEEIKAASLLSQLYPLFTRRSGYSSYQEIRSHYLLEREKERKPLKAEYKSIQFLKRRLIQVQSYFTGNEWIINMAFVILDLLFCFTYLGEMDVNVQQSCDTTKCGSINLPQYLLVFRLAGSYHVLVVLSCLRVLFMIISASLFGHISYWKYFAEKGYNILSLSITLPFIILSRVPDSRFIYLPYWLCVFTLLFNLKAWLIHKKAWAPFRVTVYREKVVILVSYIMALIFTGMCLFNYFETRFHVDQLSKGNTSGNDSLTLIRTFYFMVITMTTVGYGDISPNTAPGQISIVLIILVALVLLPVLVQDLYETIKMQHTGDGSYSNYGNPFVVVIGDLSETGRVMEFIHTLLRRNESGKVSHVVLLARGEIPSSLRYTIKHNRIRDRVFFFRGSALESKCFGRVRLDSAEAAFILTKGRVTDERMEDESNTLRAWAVDQYAPNTSIYLETRLPQTQYMAQEEYSSLGVICVAELKQIFLAYNCLYRGFSPVLLNLLRGKKSYSNSTYELPWLSQYGDGCENEIFRMPINPVFYRENFSTMAFYFYRHFQIIAFAVDIYMETTDSYHLTLNPGLSYRMKPGDYIFFIARSKEIVDAASRMSKSEYERTKIPDTKAFRRFDIVTPLPSGSMDRRSSGPARVGRRFSFVIGYPPVNPDEKAPLCILTPTPSELEESVVQDGSLLSDHFLVCTSSFDLFRFFCTLRSAHLSQNEILPILVLCPRAPTAEEFSRLRYFPNLKFMVGDYRQASVLKKAGLFCCTRVILTNLRMESVLPDEESFEFQDTTTIMLANLIEKMFREAGIPNSPVCDISLRANIHLLDYSSRSFAKRRAAKRANEEGARELHKQIDDGYNSPFYASGSVISPVMLENLISHSYHLPSTIKIFNCFAGVRYKSDTEIDMALNLQVSSFRYILVPAEFVGKSFGSLFQGLSRLSILPIGLLRDNLSSDLQNPLPFVWTNPPYSLLLSSTDLVYVLGPQFNEAQ